MLRRSSATQIGLHNIVTGEVIGDLRLEFKQNRPGNPFGGRFTKMAMSGWDRLLDAKLAGATTRVLFAMLREMRDGNRISASQGELASRCGMFRPDVSRAIRDLVERGIVRRRERGTYLLDPHIGFNGKADAHAQAIAEWENQKLRVHLVAGASEHVTA